MQGIEWQKNGDLSLARVARFDRPLLDLFDSKNIDLPTRVFGMDRRSIVFSVADAGVRDVIDSVVSAPKFIALQMVWQGKEGLDTDIPLALGLAGFDPDQRMGLRALYYRRCSQNLRQTPENQERIRQYYVIGKEMSRNYPVVEVSKLVGTIVQEVQARNLPQY